MSLRQPAPTFDFRGHRLITAPAVEPVSADELRTMLKEDVSELGDSEAERLIASARQFVEEITGIALITQEWEMTLDRWPGYGEPWWDGVREGHVSQLKGRAKPVTLPRYPLQSVDSVKTYDLGDTETTITVSTVFNVDLAARPGRMHLKAGQTWPIATRDFDAIHIGYTAGFGDAPADVPPVLRDAVLLLAAYHYNHRGECDMSEAWKKSGVAASASLYMSRGI
jgi:hypothetical protein